MDRMDWNSLTSGEAEPSVEPDYALRKDRFADDDSSDGEDGFGSPERPSAKSRPRPVRDSFEDLGASLVRNASRSRPDTSLAFHGRMSEMMSEALFEQIAVERSEIAFKEFYDFLAPKVYSVIFRMLRSEDDALDILQEVFTSFWNSAPDLYKVHSNISAWILLLARNRAVDETRSTRFQKQRQMESYDVLDHEYLIADTHAPDEKLTEDAGRIEIQRAFEILSEDQRKIMELIYFAGMTVKAVAETVHLTPGAVRKTVHDAVKKLRLVIKPDDADLLQLNKPPKELTKKKVVQKQKRPEASTLPVSSNITEAPEFKKIPKEKTVKPEASIKKATRIEGKSRRAMKLHSILDDLINNQEDVLEIPTQPDHTANTTLDTP
jgi:RNA polymerase sigma factor (sigma-70 family)